MNNRLNIIKNKKGDLPITILVIGVFVVCTLALLNFYIETISDKNFFEGVILIEKVRELSENIKFYNRLEKKNSLELTGLSGKGIEKGNFKFEGRESEKDYEISGTLFETKYIIFEGKKIASVEYNFIKSQPLT